VTNRLRRKCEGAAVDGEDAVVASLVAELKAILFFAAFVGLSVGTGKPVTIVAFDIAVAAICAHPRRTNVSQRPATFD